MFVLLGMSVLGSVVIVLKVGQFFHLKISSFKEIRLAINAYRKNQIAIAQKTLQKTRNPASEIVHVIIMGQQSGAPVEMIKEEAQRMGNLMLASLRKHFRTLEIIGTLSPLLGLLGTVLGIIDAFHQLELAGSKVDISQLSGGIWVALLTTAAGLSVGIPAVIALNWLESKTEDTAQQMEDVATQLFTHEVYPSTEKEEVVCNSFRSVSQSA
ncbi:MAG: MotA/TolQ/ExbB proton channel family protein [Methylocystaceae bacterium]|nr:MotA/TolQ/ExbB proton channel family protein [Methylocystaceae bacterium]